MWIILGIISGILVMFIGIHFSGMRASPPQTPNPEAIRLSIASLTNVPTQVKSILQEVIEHSINASKPSGTSREAALLSSKISKIMEPTSPVDRDPLLKLFDEL
jgi:hypothetical protein